MGDFASWFEKCEICGGQDWNLVFQGFVRDGAFGKLTDNESFIARCKTCRVERLNEAACKDLSFYQGEEYRRILDEPTDAEGFFEKHDLLQIQNLNVLWPESFRGKTVADVGCGAGSFLDHIRGLAKEILAFDPCTAYHQSLKDRGYKVYSLVPDAYGEREEEVDFAFSFSVIEHIPNPRLFLQEISKLLGKDGRLLISTPNRTDVLMDLLGGVYRSFFYRTVHRWYFDEKSFTHCASEAGLEVVHTKCVHRFGLSNAMYWLREQKPMGNSVLPHLNSEMLDNVWKNYLEAQGIGDYLYFFLKRKS